MLLCALLDTMLIAGSLFSVFLAGIKRALNEYPRTCIKYAENSYIMGVNPGHLKQKLEEHLPTSG